jgi:hypothetical protein
MGPHQAPRQSGPNMGMDETGMVEPISMIDDGFMYPSVDGVIRVTISHAM